MSGVNKVILIGNVGNDPEVRQVGSTQVIQFSLATSESWKDKSTGERKEKTEWHRCKAWGKQAEIIQQYVGKGSKLYVEGKLETSSYEKNGEKRYSTEINVRDFQMLDSKGERSGGDYPSYGSQQRNAAPAPAEEPLEDEIPF